MGTEADTCRKYIVPQLQKAGWDDAPCAIQEQRTFTDGRVHFVGGAPRRGTRKRADYILRYRPDYPIAVIEAKAGYRSAKDGVQQAKDYAQVLGLRFAYASNGQDIIEIDLFLGTETQRPDFPTPSELWSRIESQLSIPGDEVTKLLQSGFPDPERPLRYYQEIAVNRTIEAILSGQHRCPDHRH
jgi:type I restriction enzyme R subunit